MKFICILSLTSIFLSCQSGAYSSKKPDDLIDRDTLVMALKELSLIESHIQDAYVHVGVFKDVMKRSGDFILEKYHLSPKRFENTMDYYGMRQEEMQGIYSQVLDSLNKDASMLPEDSFTSPDSLPPSLLHGFPGTPR